MWNDGKPAKFSCKNITHEHEMCCLTRKQDRFPNSGLISFGFYRRFVNRLEICKGSNLKNNVLFQQIERLDGACWMMMNEW